MGERSGTPGHRPLQPRLPGRPQAGARSGQGVQERLRRERLRRHRAHQAALRPGPRPGAADLLHHQRDAKRGPPRFPSTPPTGRYRRWPRTITKSTRTSRPSPTTSSFTRERASGFYGTPLIAHLTRLGISSLIVCGESTSGCVRASVVDAYSNGYHASIVEGMCFRPQHHVPQGQPVRPASQIRRRHEAGGGEAALQPAAAQEGRVGGRVTVDRYEEGRRDHSRRPSLSLVREMTPRRASSV